MRTWFIAAIGQLRASFHVTNKRTSEPQKMAYLIRFRTEMFDVSKERPNPINPIFGESVLWWLREQAGPLAQMTEPGAEDWGWYSYVEWNGRHYLIGASTEGVAKMREWTLQIHKRRSIEEKIFGRERETADDPCVMYIRGLIESQQAFQDVSLELG
jgi:hypothetical protein